MKSFFVITALIIAARCTTVQKAKTGADAFDRKQYFLAASLYEKEFGANAERNIRAKLAYGAAMSYQKTNETARSIPWFREAAELGFGDVAWRQYGLALIQNRAYDEAIAVFESRLQEKGNSEEFRLLLSSARQAKALYLDKLDIYEVYPLPVNTEASEYAPVISVRGELLFTSDRPSGTGEENYKWTGRKFSDLFTATEGSSEATLLDPAINTTANEGTACFSQDGNILFFTRCGLSLDQPDAYCKLFVTKRDGAGWSEPQVLAFQKEQVNYMHPCLAASDSVLFFVSDHERGEGGFDIYYSEWKEDDWSEPERLGKRINSPSNEKFPFMFRDTLYFASDRLGGLGGLDIYKSFVNENGDWQPPINLKSPLNSSEDDFALIIDPGSSEDGQVHGFFSSSREGGMGKDDLYRFVRTKADESILIAQEPGKPEDSAALKKPVRYQAYLSIRVVQTIRENPDDPNSRVIGKNPIPNTLVLLREGATPIQLRTNNNGNVLREINYDENYFVLATAPGLLNASREISTYNERDENNPTKTFNVEITLDRPFTGKEVLIPDIFYDLDKWDIRPDAEPPLNTLVQLLKDNPRIRIQLSSHTDCRGTDEYNLDLSQKRAQAAIEYLIKNGIDVNRLLPKGYGETQLINKCICEQCTEDEHQANRRTTFIVLE
ncbi:MAG TPA: OmpA family protein [Saprospiraceae bacterium]|nr:OmpA family protein [Saprospiraceae bacterium]HNT21948.1 OmpA family protein [Saprospiraceae bacterium]